MANWYCSTVGWSAVTIWAAVTAYNVGDLRRQTAALGTLTVGNERVFRCTTAGTSGAVEPAWVLTKGATTTENVGTTNVPVWTEVTGNETYNATTFAAPHARLQTACKSGWPAAGDTIFVAADHAETQAAAMTIAGVGTIASPLRVVCIAATHSSTPVAADLAITATCTTTAGNAITITGSMYCYGVLFTSGSGANTVPMTLNASGADLMIFDNCTLKLGGTSGGNILIAGTAPVTANAQRMELRNCIMNFSAAGSWLAPRSMDFLWDGGSLAGTAPTNLLVNSGNTMGFSLVEIRNVDLSGIGASKFLVNLGNATTNYKIKFVNCKLSASLGGVTTGTITGPNQYPVDLITSDSTANVVVREEHYAYSGSMVQDTTNFRTGGASDGTTSKAWKVVTVSGANRIYPFFCPDIYQWVNSTGSKTISVYCANNSSVTAQDLDIGFELEYMGSSASPLGTYDSTTPAALGLISTGTNWATDSSTWGGSTTTKQVMTKTVTVNQKGWVRVRPYVSKASFTVWIDPLITVA